MHSVAVVTVKRYMLAVGLLCAAALGACGGDDTAEPAGDRSAVPLTVEAPTTVTGVLDISVEEGPVGGDGISEVNFGSVELDDGFVLVQVPAEVVRAARLSRDVLVSGREFRVEIAGEGSFFDPAAPAYLVSALEPVG